MVLLEELGFKTERRSFNFRAMTCRWNSCAAHGMKIASVWTSGITVEE